MCHSPCSCEHMSELSLAAFLPGFCSVVEIQKTLLLAESWPAVWTCHLGSNLSLPFLFSSSSHLVFTNSKWMERLLSWLLVNPLLHVWQPWCGLFYLHGHSSWDWSEALPEWSSVRKHRCTEIKVILMIFLDKGGMKNLLAMLNPWF